jgi:hypothetical protein
MENHFGRYEIVQTVVKDPEKLPLHLLADEKITWLNGEKVVVATTVGGDCVLGVSVALSADEENLTEAYQYFKEEAQALKADYAPETVNTDGWAATQRAWLKLITARLPRPPRNLFLQKNPLPPRRLPRERNLHPPPFPKWIPG